RSLSCLRPLPREIPSCPRFYEYSLDDCATLPCRRYSHLLPAMAAHHNAPRRALQSWLRDDEGRSTGVHSPSQVVRHSTRGLDSVSIATAWLEQATLDDRPCVGTQGLRGPRIDA